MDTVSSAVKHIRKASREIVRELGLISTDSLYKIPLSMRHVLIELETHQALSHNEIATLLNLEKSTVSRLIKKMVAMKAVTLVTQHSDQRYKHIKLTDLGQKFLTKVNTISNQQVVDAIENLTSDERQRITDGIDLYAKSLKFARIKKEYFIRPIQKKDNTALMLLIKDVLKEHQADHPGTAFQDEELLNLHKAYSSIKSRYFVLERLSDHQIVGGVGIGPLQGGDKEICELKKMYLSSQTRGLGLGKLLLQEVLNAATQFGYKKCYLETLSNMRPAQSLYQKMGFQYLDKPLGNTGHHSCDVWMMHEL